MRSELILDGWTDAFECEQLNFQSTLLDGYFFIISKHSDTNLSSIHFQNYKAIIFSKFKKTKKITELNSVRLGSVQFSVQFPLTGKRTEFSSSFAKFLPSSRELRVHELNLPNYGVHAPVSASRRCVCHLRSSSSHTSHLTCNTCFFVLVCFFFALYTASRLSNSNFSG